MLVEGLLGASLALGGYQDFRTRKTKDWAWLPAATGGALATWGVHTGWIADPTLGFRVAIVVLLSALAVKKNLMGTADLFGFVAVAALPYFFEFIFVLLAFALVSMGSLVLTARSKGTEAALKEGYPFVTWLGIAFTGTILLLGLILPQSFLLSVF